MKKLIFILSVFIILVSASCKRSYTCYCLTPTIAGGFDTAYTTTSASTQTIARTQCQALTDTTNGHTKFCYLK